MGADTWLFSVCGVVLAVGGWWLYPSVNRLLARGADDPIVRGRAWLPAVAGLCQWGIGAAWILTFLAMAGEFNEYMFGLFPTGGDTKAIATTWLRLVSALVFMLGFVGTTAMWAWHRGYNRAKQGGEPLGRNPFDF